MVPEEEEEDEDSFGMASFEDLQLDWSSLCQECPECWTVSDLQLAAELGKTLLERNKELETSLKQHQNVIEDQTQEIEYLTKQTVALREVNDSRLRIYEQLEVSIQDLERANHRLALDNAADKKHIKSLTVNIETLESKCEELQGTIDELKSEVDGLRRKTQKVQELNVVANAKNARTPQKDRDESNLSFSPDIKNEKVCDSFEQVQETNKTLPDIAPEVSDADGNSEQINQLVAELRDSRTRYEREQRRVTELEDQLATMVQQNQTLERQFLQHHFKEEEGKSMHEELNTLEEVRQGHLCSRCLRTMDSSRTADDVSSFGDEPEDDDRSMLEALCNDSQYRSSFYMEVQEVSEKSPPSNLYRDLVEKYEALLEVKRHQSPRYKNHTSLHEEMKMLTKDTDDESGQGDSLKPEKTKSKVSHTPTDFSEAETSSSGFADETSTKGTQTEGRTGAYLCTIADGEDCKFSIYDDASPFDSRFRNRPEYRELFREIFTVLKKAAENKDEGEQLPLLDDHTVTPKVPPVTPANENLPDFPDNFTNDDSQSIVSSTISELSTAMIDDTIGATATMDQISKSNDPAQSATVDSVTLRPYKREPLEYLTVAVNVRKRSSSRRKRQQERSDSPFTPILGSPKITYTSRPSSGKRRDNMRKVPEQPNPWNGDTLHFYSRSSSTPTKVGVKYDPAYSCGPSEASHNLHKLKNLEMSYAEVLRNADSKKRERQRRKR